MRNKVCVCVGGRRAKKDRKQCDRSENRKPEVTQRHCGDCGGECALMKGTEAAKQSGEWERLVDMTDEWRND